MNGEKMKSALCVGGPRDGQRVAILHGNGFCVPATEPEKVAATDAYLHMRDEPVTVQWTNYRGELFHTEQGQVMFWVPADQTPLETITMLAEGYEQARRNSRR